MLDVLDLSKARVLTRASLPEVVPGFGGAGLLFVLREKEGPLPGVPEYEILKPQIVRP